MTPPPNILLVTVDCLRADVLGCYGGPARMPHADQLAAQGIRYTHAFAHSSFTKPTFPPLFSSTYPTEYGGSARFAPERPDVVGMLRAAGYHTLGVNSNPWLAPRFGFGRGFDEYVDLSDATPVAHALPVRALNHLLGIVGGGLIFPPYPSAQTVTAAARDLLRTARLPFFLWVHYMDAHWPYDLPRARLFGPWDREHWAYNARLARRSRRQPETVTARERNALWALYRRGVERVDRSLGRLLDAVGQEAAVLLTADHGEAFGEHGRFFHEAALHRENVQVPLLLRAPAVAAGQREPGIVRHLDVAPTLIDLAGVPPPDAFRGTSLLPAARGERPLPSLPAFSEIRDAGQRWVSLREDGWAALARLDPDTGEALDAQLYHYASDPSEQRDRATDEPERLDALLARLRDYASGKVHDVSLAPAESLPDDDPDLIERLKALGYL